MGITIDAIRQLLHQKASIMTAPIPGTQIRPNKRITGDSVFILLACADGEALSLSVPDPMGLITGPLNDGAWAIVIRHAAYVLEPREG